MKQYYSIGETAKLNNISVQTLRYYDKLGLFEPERVDLNNGYRFYHVRQFFYLDIIKSLKYIQVPLEDIKKVILDTPENMLLFLNNQESLIQKEKERILQAEQLLDRRKQQLDEQIEISRRCDEREIYSRFIGEQPILKAVTPNASPHNEPNFLVRELAAILEDQCSMIDNQCGYTFEMKAYQDSRQIHYTSVFTSTPHKNIKLNINEKHIEYASTSPGEYVCTAFEWSLQDYIYYYQKLYEYIKVSKIKTDGEVYEVSIPINYSVLRKDRFLTELRVKKVL